MKKLLILCIVSLAGCGGYQPPDPPQRCDSTTSYGMCVGFDEDAEKVPVEDFDVLYRETVDCMKQYGDFKLEKGPVVRVTKDLIFGHSGWTDIKSLQITLRTAGIVFRHETVHYILGRDSGDIHVGHDHPAFGVCDGYPMSSYE